ncbi:MAG: hypothetical protein JW847_09870 [Candidatus Omnitrophica bacterium]|nr:hypothetical protein [Candidatus Omnitrophota bacterium]
MGKRWGSHAPVQGLDMNNTNVLKESDGTRMKKFFNSHFGVLMVFLLCFSYWSYLLFNSRMEIKHDAIGYEQLGTMIYKEGWGEFFKTGPHREPLYPLIIAVSMRIANIARVPYQDVQRVIQIMILFMTQLFMVAILSKSKISKWIILAVIYYFGFSPAVVNSVFSLFSEIAVYPFVLGIVYFGYLSWRDIHCSNDEKVVLWAVMTSLAFAGASFGKGIFQYVFAFFLVPFFCAMLRSLILRDWRVSRKAFVYIVITVCIVGTTVISYRSLNEKYNGSFEFTNRYDFLLFGNAAKRVEKMDKDLFLAHILSVPGGGVCRAVFPEEACRYSEFHYADQYRAMMLPKLLEGTRQEDVSKKTISLAFEMIFRNPVQYAVLTALESLKMGFWESTQMGYVLYPQPLNRFFSSAVVKNGVRFLLAILTYFSLFYCGYHVYRRRSRLFCSDTIADVRVQMEFIILIIVVLFTGLYSAYSILTRFALPITVLYMCCIAFTMQNILEYYRCGSQRGDSKQ